MIWNTIKFYENHDNCPTCKQGIDEEHKKNHVAEKEAKKTELAKGLEQLLSTIGEAEERIARINEVTTAIESLQKQIGVIQTEVVSNQKYITKLQSEIEDLQIEGTDNTDTSDKMLDNEEKLNVLLSKKESLVEQAHYCAFILETICFCVLEM